MPRSRSTCLVFSSKVTPIRLAISLANASPSWRNLNSVVFGSGLNARSAACANCRNTGSCDFRKVKFDISRVATQMNCHDEWSFISEIWSDIYWKGVAITRVRYDRVDGFDVTLLPPAARCPPRASDNSATRQAASQPPDPSLHLVYAPESSPLPPPAVPETEIPE